MKGECKTVRVLGLQINKSAVGYRKAGKGKLLYSQEG